MDAREIYLAGGCFWGTEAYLRKLPGVLGTEVGYANGTVDAPTYEEVCQGRTGAVECVRVEYDADVIELSLLLEAFFRTIDPMSVNRQGNDCGPQYRTGIYWTDDSSAFLAKCNLAELSREIGEPLAIEAQELESFWPAEDYHQGYLAKNPGGYCHVNLADANAFIAEHSGEFGQIDRVVRLEPPTGRA